MSRNTKKIPVRIGWVGSGFVGQVAHLVNYAGIPDIEIAGLAELRPKLGKQVCERYGIPRYFKNHKELIDNLELDAVVAIVRREHTASVALDVLSKGISLFTEKPMAPTVVQGKKLVEAATKHGSLYVAGFMRRYDQGVQIAKHAFNELVDTGELGDVLFFRSYCFGGGDYCNIDGNQTTEESPPRHRILPISPDWLPPEFEREYETFLNVFVHDINLIRFLVGYTPEIEHVDYRPHAGSLALNFRGFAGVFEFAHLQTNRYWEEGIEILFSKGRMVIQLPPAFLRNQAAIVKIYKERPQGATETISPTPDWTWAFKRQAEAFVDNLVSNSSSLASGNDSLEDLRFIETVWKKIACN